MDRHRFDGLTKIMGQQLSRRSALRRIGARGVAAVTVGGVGLNRRAAFAQDATPVPASADDELCIVPFEATVRTGPDAGMSLAGFLALAIGPDGGINQGALAQPEGDTLPVVGQVTGRAVNLMITVAEGQTVFGVGTSEEDFRAACRASAEGGLYSPVGQLGGPFVGPNAEDGGDWIACCCPSDANNYDCGDLPACGRCRPPSGGGPTPDPDCVIACYAAGYSTQACRQACLQG